MTTTPAMPERIWTCQIGGHGELPQGADGPMRDAIASAFKAVTGSDASYCFSGWGQPLPERYRAVVENRLPDPDAIRHECFAVLDTLPDAVTAPGGDFAALQAQPAAVSDERLLEIGREWTKEVGWYEFEVNDFIGCARAILALRPQAVPMTDEQAVLEDEEFSLLSQTQVAALLWVLWCHQGASSPVGQPIRFALGMDKRQAMSDEQVSAAQRFRIDWHQWSGITAPAGGEG